MKELHVPDMHCGHCVARIEKALEAAGIVGKVTLETQTVAVPEETEAAVRELLDDLGFEADA